MKTSRIILIGAFLFVAGVVGFVTSYLKTHEKSTTPARSQVNLGEGFLPISIPLDQPLEAPTLAPTITPTSGLAGTPTAVATLPAESGPALTTTPQAMLVPDRIVIEKIDLDAPVVLAQENKITVNSVEYLQYLAPDEFAAGWHPNSAYLGAVGNTVINGHHNVHGKVFGRLVELVPGDRITVFSKTTSYTFQVANVLILPERDADLAQRLDNARWIEPSNDIRLTLVTCWPEYSNTHRLIIVASLLPESFDRKELQ